MNQARLARVVQRLSFGVLLVGMVGWPLHLLTYRLLELADFDLSRFWTWVGDFLGLGGPGLRLVVYGALQFEVFRRAPAVLDRLKPAGRWLDRQRRGLEGRLPARWRRRLRLTAGGLGAIAVILLLVQPTRAPLSRPSLGERAANLLDGTAAAALVDGAVASVYWLTAEPVRLDAPPVPVDAFTATLDDPVVPLMDRWDADLLAAADGDERLAAQLKAIMWVESGGRQYAVSSTGCAGLMQFCAGTAQDRPYREIFGIGRVQTCGCRSCAVPREVRVALETEPDAVDRFADRFPCPLTDARFDGPRSLRAGAAYVRRLSAKVGGNLLLVYIGYNSGPRVAHTLYARLGEPDHVDIDDLRPHLAAALQPYYGRRSAGRARGLLDVHLPKLERALRKWRPR